MNSESKNANVFAGIVAMLVGITVGVGYGVGFWKLVAHDNAILRVGVKNPAAAATPLWLQMAGVLFLIMCGVVLAYSFGHWTDLLLKSLFKKRAQRLHEALVPVLYRSENNGITALVTRKDYDEAAAKYYRGLNDQDFMANRGMEILHVVPTTMLFCADDHNYPININNFRTGNIEDMKALTAGCEIKNRPLFVPFSSFVMGDKGWHLRTFGIPTFRNAQTTIRNEKENRLAAFRKRRNEVVVMVASAIVGTASFVGILYRPLDAPIAEKIALSIATGIALIILMVIARRRRLRSL